MSLFPLPRRTPQPVPLEWQPVSLVGAGLLRQSWVQCPEHGGQYRNHFDNVCGCPIERQEGAS
ncbi:hypothetical protein [Streptacidiphilus sp. EB129]|uniref:hypothetical protein n=1 Tax=Streptacidiphilus sp. EB129 TaxID=3156262 RepID=UPI003515E83A